MMAKLETDGKGWWWSVQCLWIADVVDLECSLALFPRDLEVSPMLDDIHPSALHCQ